MAKSDTKKIKGGKVSNETVRFSKVEWDAIAELVMAEYDDRKSKRVGLEQHWAEIDRQLRMEPDLKRKRDRSGRDIPGLEWRAENELPLQAQTLEVLTADARRMMLPSAGRSWFGAEAYMPDEYLERVDFSAMIAGDLNEVPSQVDQLDANLLAMGFLQHNHKAGDFGACLDRLNAEAFKYGTFVGRALMVERSVWLDTARGTIEQKEQIPVLVPHSIKQTYLDTSMHVQMRQGYNVGPSQIFFEKRVFHDIVMAASAGNSDPDDFIDGGWLQKNISRLEPDGDSNVECIEMEGDLIIPRKTKESIYLPNCIATVASGANRQLIRLRFSPHPWSSYIHHPYHIEDVSSPYGTSPLMKGRTIHLAAVEALNEMTDVGMLQSAPPVGFNRDDPGFAANDINIEPNVTWETADPNAIKVFEIGDLASSNLVYQNLLSQYFDVTGAAPARMGAQTVSHTTLGAKQIEAEKGQSRTVDYATSVLDGPLTKWLYMHYEMGRKFKKKRAIYLPSPANNYVEITGSDLPPRCTFEVFGSGGPAEEQIKGQQRLQGAQLAIQLELQARQFQDTTGLDMTALSKEIMRNAGWTDLDAFYRQNTPTPQGQAGGTGADGLVSPGIATSAPGGIPGP